jgi:hypothetical protein
MRTNIDTEFDASIDLVVDQLPEGLPPPPGGDPEGTTGAGWISINCSGPTLGGYADEAPSMAISAPVM